jgi:hypothetical protein
MNAFLEATAAARKLNDALQTARAHGLILVVDLGELNQTPEVSVFLAGHENDVEDPAPRLRLVK